MLAVVFNSAAPKFVAVVAPMVAVVCAHRLPPVAKGEGTDRGDAVGLVAGVNLGLEDRPMEAKMSSSCLGAAFLGGGFCIFSPRLVTLCGIESDKPRPVGADLGAVGSRPAEKGGFDTGGDDLPSVSCHLGVVALGDRFGTI